MIYSVDEKPATKVVVLSGGVGGAKLALGLYRLLPPQRLTIVANTGDDFEHFGLYICPDLDTVMYTLAGIANPDTGWGRANETWTFMQAIAAFSDDTWFQLGDADLALHIERSRRLRRGESLSSVTDHLRRCLGVEAALLPMSDDPLRTWVETETGPLAFQDYFVKRRCRPVVTGLRFAGSDTARPSPGFLDALADPELAAVIIAPSNPFLSIDPMLSMPGLVAALKRCHAPLIAVSPIIGGEAVKGPAAKMMRELGLPSTAAAVARHYGELLDGFVMDTRDAALAAQVKPATLTTQTLMTSLADRKALAREVLAFAGRVKTICGR